MAKKIIKDFLYEYEDESYQIRGACFEVWKHFGGAFKESVIDRSLRRELERMGLQVDSQVRVPVFYKGEKVGEYVPDYVVNGKILIEVKCKPFITREDERQFWTYLKGSSYRLGFLVNFGSEKLEIRRRVYDRARQKGDFSVNQRSYQRQSASKRSGFSLVELLIYIAIAGGLMVTLISIFTVFTQSRGRAEAQSEVHANLRTSMDRIAQEVKKATSVTTPASGGNGNTLVFVRTSPATTEFQVSSSKLQTRECAAACASEAWVDITSSKVIVDTSASSVFARIDNTGAKTTVQVKLTIKYNDQGRQVYKYSRSAQTTVSLR